MVLLTILAVLFLTLIVLVPFLEKNGPQLSDKEMAKYSRWVFPAFIMLSVLGVIGVLFF